MTNVLRAGALTLAMSALVLAGEWKLDTPHSSAAFAVRHLGVSTVHGAFGKVTGTASYDPANPAAASVNVTIDAASVSTRDENRDKDLRSPNFFDVEKYPTLTFVSKKVIPEGAGKLQLVGDLTIHGVTKETVLEVEGPSAPIKDPWGNARVGASATTKINRKDFGITWNKTLDNGGVVVGDEVAIEIEVELVQAK
jgi:polyisoprenoid-binding protein YceI